MQNRPFYYLCHLSAILIGFLVSKIYLTVSRTGSIIILLPPRSRRYEKVEEERRGG
jgi:hypothetical protein